MRIIVVTPVYPSKYNPKDATPVVHYFAKEWVRLGHEVKVFHIASRFPALLYLFNRIFERKLNSSKGYAVPVHAPSPYIEHLDGVEVNHLTVRALKPSLRMKKTAVSRICNIIDESVERFVPDVCIGHWDNPQLEVLSYIKRKHANIRTCIVLHSLSHNLANVYGNGEFCDLIKDIDVIGFRNIPSRNKFVSQYGPIPHSFIAYSGISNDFIENAQCKTFSDGINNSYVFVGMLIQRKHPTKIVTALKNVYADDSFSVTFIGSGNETEKIQSEFNNLNCKGSIHFTGKLPRKDVISYLKACDVFVMISDNETFGLVYLEAMSMGCITIASVGGGIDGIIKDGFNGFLCNPGDVSDLCRILSTIRSLSTAELSLISRNAMITAKEYSDIRAAERYLESIVMKECKL